MAPDVAVGAEVADALALAPPDHRRPGPLVVDGHGQPRVALVVLQPDVEAGLVRLMSEYSRMRASTSLSTTIHSTWSAWATIWAVRGGSVAESCEVVGQAVAQGLGLAHVEDPALGVEELVGARGVGDGAGGAADHCITSARLVAQPPPCAGRPAYTGGSAGLVSGVHTSLRGRHPRGWATRLSPPATIGALPKGGQTTCSGSRRRSPSATPAAPGDELAAMDRRRQGGARLPAASSSATTTSATR